MSKFIEAKKVGKGAPVVFVNTHRILYIEAFGGDSRIHFSGKGSDALLRVALPVDEFAERLNKADRDRRAAPLTQSGRTFA